MFIASSYTEYIKKSIARVTDSITTMVRKLLEHLNPADTAIYAIDVLVPCLVGGDGSISSNCMSIGASSSSSSIIEMAGASSKSTQFLSIRLGHFTHKNAQKEKKFLANRRKLWEEWTKESQAWSWGKSLQGTVAARTREEEREHHEVAPKKQQVACGMFGRHFLVLSRVKLHHEMSVNKARKRKQCGYSCGASLILRLLTLSNCYDLTIAGFFCFVLFFGHLSYCS